MNINQHNYEEFFLLYVDGELSAADKQAVEQFVQANPGLAEELEILGQVTLPPDAVVFDDKDLLYKNGVTGIGIDNYEEKFLLYVDNELDGIGNQQVETFVLQHPALQETFTLLKQTRLEADTIPFPGKQSLYRKEKKKRPVFYMGLQRLAIATVFIGMVVLAWTLFPANKSVTKQSLAKVAAPVIQPDAGTQPTGVDKDAATLKEAAGHTAAISTTITNPLPGNRNNRIQPHSIPAVIPAGRGNTEMARAEVSPATDPKIENRGADNSAAEILPHTVQLPPAYVTGDDMVKVKNSPADIPAPNSLVQPAVYRELDTEDDKKSLYLGSIEINKDKLRGFFRKATSLFRGKAKQQEDDKTEDRLSSSNTRSLK